MSFLLLIAAGLYLGAISAKAESGPGRPNPVQPSTLPPLLPNPPSPAVSTRPMTQAELAAYYAEQNEKARQSHVYSVDMQRELTRQARNLIFGAPGEPPAPSAPIAPRAARTSACRTMDELK